MNTKPLPPTEYMNECFTYDPISGKLFWKVRPRSHFRTHHGWIKSNSQFAGTEAGCKIYQPNGLPGSVTVMCSYRTIVASRVIFALMGVNIPAGFEVDHQNTDPFDNSWNNLRLATLSQNRANRKHQRSKKEGIPKGVQKRGNKFAAHIMCEGQSFNLGTFDTPELAHAAYCTKATEVFGEFARFN